MIVWGRNLDHAHASKLDDAIDRGFDPGEDYNQPAPAHLRAPEGVDPLTVFAAQVEAARLVEHGCHVEGCSHVRCDRCDERLTCIGPEPRACGTTCQDCPCDCTACQLVRDDIRAELLHQIEKEEGR